MSHSLTSHSPHQYSRSRPISSRKSNFSDTAVAADSSKTTPFDMTVYESSFDALNALDSSDTSTQDDMLLGSYSTPPFEQVPGFDLQDWDFTWAIFDENTLAASICHRPTDINVDVLFRFPFLDNFTKSTGFAESFECGSSEQRMSQTLELYNSRFPGRLISSESLCNVTETRWIKFTTTAVRTVYEESNLDQHVGRLLLKTHEIVSLIRETTLKKPQRSIITASWSTSLEAHCYEFFHPENIEKFLALFWSYWNPNWPTIHRPTFIANDRSPCLIAAMVIVGACLSPEHRDCGMAQIWLNTIEEMIFSHELFSHPDPAEAWSNPGDEVSRQTQIDVLQAAFCVCLYQTWEGSKQGRKRVLRHRYNELIFVSCSSIARSVD